MNLFQQPEYNRVSIPQLRPYQTRLMEDFDVAVAECSTQVRKEKARNVRFLAVMPTGAGKTVFFCHYSKNLFDKGARVLILVHRMELILQTVDKLRSFGLQPAVIQGDEHYQRYHPLQVASVQTLIRKKDRQPPGFDFIVVDEAHHTPANSYATILDWYKNALVMGVTATPCRSTGKGLGEFFDRMVIGPSVKELIQMGSLSKYKAFGGTLPNLKDIKLNHGDYNQRELAMLMSGEAILGNIVQSYRKHAEGRRSVVFGVNVEHSQKMAQLLKDAGYPSQHIDGETPHDQRAKILGDYRAGHIQFLCNCNIVSEGFDLPEIGCAIDCAPTKSLSLYLQRAGRILRPAPDKEYAVFLDHAGNVKEHGLPCDDRDWALIMESTKRKKEYVAGENDEFVEKQERDSSGRSYVIVNGEYVPELEEYVPDSTVTVEMIRLFMTGGKLKSDTKNLLPIEMLIYRLKQLIHFASKNNRRPLWSYYTVVREIKRKMTKKELEVVSSLVGVKKGWAYYEGFKTYEEIIS